MDKNSKPRRPEDVDKLISAEIPDKAKFLELHSIITQTLIHGPCGQIDPTKMCMEGKTKDETCSKGFPKPFNNTGTTLSDNNYANYQRRDALHGGQLVLFEEGQEEDALEDGPPNTTLTEYFDLNKIDPDARTILYPDICQTYRFTAGKWILRKRNTAITGNANQTLSDTVGRIPIITLNPKQSELYYLRMLLYHVPGPQSFEDLEVVDGFSHEMFQNACRARGLLSDDTEIDTIMNEATTFRFGMGLRDLFASLLAYSNPNDPKSFWDHHKDILSEDFAHASGRPGLPNLYDFSSALIEIKDLLANLELSLEDHFGIQIPCDVPAGPTNLTSNFYTDLLAAYSYESYQKMNADQRKIYDAVIESVEKNSGICFSLNAPGGTGKTFVLKAILAKVRSENQIAVATAISGIAATLLPQGRTLHSKLKPPIDITEFSTCDIVPRSTLARDLRSCKLLIIDEVTMGNRQIFEAVERSLRDLTGRNRLFGGITTVLTGDWSQILPVVKHGSKAEIINACLKQSAIWSNVQDMKLTKLTKLELMRLSCDESDDFAQFLLSVGDGSIEPVSESEPDLIKVPTDLLLPENTLQCLCDFTYNELSEKFDSHEWLCERSILSVTNEATESVNKEVLARSPGSDNKRKSADISVVLGTAQLNLYLKVSLI